MQLSRGRISQNALAKLSSELVGRLAVFGLVLLAARSLGETQFGLFNYALALGFVVGQLADLGLQMVISREIAADPADSARLVPRALQIKVLLSILVIGVLALAAWRSAPGARLALFAVALVPLLQTYLEFVAYVFRGRQQVDVEARLLAAGRLVTAAAGALALVLGLGLAGLALGQLLSAFVFTLFSLTLLRREGWLRSAGEAIDIRAAVADRPGSRALLGQAAPLGVAIFLSIAYTRLAVLMLGQMTSAATVAHYSAATRLVEPLQLLPASLMAAVFPAFVLAVRQDRDTASVLGWRISLLLAATGVAVAAGLWLAAPWLIPWLFGPAFDEAVGVLKVAAIALPLTFVNYSLTHYLIARGQQGVLGLFTGGMLALHAALSWWFIPAFGAIGPALSIIIAESALLICCGLALWLSSPRLAGSPLATGGVHSPSTPA